MHKSRCVTKMQDANNTSKCKNIYQGAKLWKIKLELQLRIRGQM